MTTGQTASPASHEAEIGRLVALAREKGNRDVYEGKRRWVRYAIGMRLEATKTGPRPGNPWSVVAHNISGGGIGFWSTQKLAVSSRVLIREWTRDGSATWLPALVTHCAIGIRGYLVGVAFVEPPPPDGDGRGDDSGPSPPTGDDSEVSAADRRRYFHRSLAIKCAGASALMGGLGGVAASFAVTHLRSGSAGDWAWILTVVLLIGLGGLVGWLCVRRDVRFLKKFAATVRGIATGNGRAAVPAEAPSNELAVLRRAVLHLANLWQQREEDGRIQRQQLGELNQIKSNMLSIVSHDLRTPLTSILLYAQMLREELETLEAEDQRRFLATISDECTRLSRLVDDLLEMQRMESGRDRWDIRSQDLSHTIATAAHVFRAMALSKSIRFDVECPDSLPPVEADCDKVSQVLSNLLSNAMKYTPSGGTVRLAAQANGSSIIIRVADTGPGIPRDKWDQIFDRFRQLSNPNVREIAGVGLGLYIVRQIVERHGGAVWVDSDTGHGSEFFVSLPVQAASPKPDTTAEDRPSAGRILVCDADPELAAMVAQTVRGQGFQVRVVHSGCRLLAQLDQTEIDILVTDVLLPDMHASELLDSLAAVKPRSFRLIIHSYAGDGAELRRRGADIVLQRPASKEELVQAVQVAMRRQCAQGLGVLLIDGPGLDSRRMCAELGGHGHLPIVAESLAAAEDQIRQYPVEVVLLSHQGLRDDWTRLEKLKLAAENHVHVMILCETIRRRERRLAETHGVWVLPYRPGKEEEVADFVTAFREPVEAECSV